MTGETRAGPGGGARPDDDGGTGAGPDANGGTGAGPDANMGAGPDRGTGTGVDGGAGASRDRDAAGRPRNARPRDALGRPLPHGAEGVARVPDDYAPSAEEAVAIAAGYLGDERPFHAHEVFEARWKCGPDDERVLWQGLAQICVGLTHIQRGNTAGAAALLARGADRVAAYGSGETYGMDLAQTVHIARVLAGSGAEPSAAIAAIRRTLGRD
jgi:hypothetical protein